MGTDGLCLPAALPADVPKDIILANLGDTVNDMLIGKARIPLLAGSQQPSSPISIHSCVASASTTHAPACLTCLLQDRSCPSCSAPLRIKLSRSKGAGPFVGCTKFPGTHCCSSCAVLCCAVLCCAVLCCDVM